MYHTTRRSIALSLGLALLAACDRGTPVAPEIADVSASAEANVAQEPIFERPQEAEFHRLGREIEGYGGHFFDEHGNLVVHLTDPAHHVRARRLLEPSLDARSSSAPLAEPSRPSTIVVRPAEFTFAQLAAWRDRATAEVLLEPGVEFIDLDEARNRVVIGVSSPRARMSATRTLGRHAVPADAIVFEDAGPAHEEVQLVEPQVWAPVQHTLRHRVVNQYRLVGGYQIRGVAQGSTLDECTLGFHAGFNGHRVFLTSSDCTDARWALDGTRFHHPSPDYEIGREVVDRIPAFSCPPYPQGVACRSSDATVVLFTASEVVPVEAAIARTTIRAEGAGVSGSIVVNQEHPWIPITGELSYPLLNRRLDKVGRSTGWTSGVVDRTCVDVIQAPQPPYNRPLILQCQVFIRDMHAAPGDRGSPVFAYHAHPAIPGFAPATATLAGMYWGSRTSGGKVVSVMSPMRNIRMDYPALGSTTSLP